MDKLNEYTRLLRYAMLILEENVKNLEVDFTQKQQKSLGELIRAKLGANGDLENK